MSSSGVTWGAGAVTGHGGDRTAPRSPLSSRTVLPLVQARDGGGARLHLRAGALELAPLRAGATVAGALPAGRGATLLLLGEHAHGLLTRPHLRGHRRLPAAAPDHGWTTRFTVVSTSTTTREWRARLEDDAAGLALDVRATAEAGGLLGVRYELTNIGEGDYALDGLEVVLPVADWAVEVVDFTGRHERERSPQRSTVTDGLYLREARGGRPGLEGTGLVCVGSPGVDTDRGRVAAVHVAWAGNTVHRVERDSATPATIGGGELLLPGEVVLAPGASYATPLVLFAVSDDGLDGIAHRFHLHERELAAHPGRRGHQPVTLNVWEAVFFDHDLPRLLAIAERAARVGVERFVLDDGWFLHRRDDHAGLGDWEVDPAVWPDGLAPLADRVHELGMEFGLWFEPEMVNPDSDLARAHPEWILGPVHRDPLLERHQQVLDLTVPQAWAHVHDRMDAVLASARIDAVKWDHNRPLVEAISRGAGGRPAAREQTLAYRRLLDSLRRRHPHVAWESCASGGGRIDLDTLTRVERVWTSDMTDAHARVSIQRWALQLVAPEYLGAHVSAPRSHTTGRTWDLDFRCAVALPLALGIEWDLTTASEEDLDVLALWVGEHRRLRPLLHGGRTVRPSSSDPAVVLHGVVAPDGRRAVLSHAQLDESTHNRGVWVRVPGLESAASFTARWVGRVERREVSKSAPLPALGPIGEDTVTGAELAERGLWLPRRPPGTACVIELQAR
ncbi:alpha-galactosidase [Nocardioides sp.]|uniref:alpha-galactosidase n=1 Tax=Nocardioides sp. TaxID=35761 RepID=UPI003519A4A7